MTLSIRHRKNRFTWFGLFMKVHECSLNVAVLSFVVIWGHLRSPRSHGDSARHLKRMIKEFIIKIKSKDHIFYQRQVIKIISEKEVIWGRLRSLKIIIQVKLNYMSKHFAEYKWFCRFDDDVFVKVNVDLTSIDPTWPGIFDLIRSRKAQMIPNFRWESLSPSWDELTTRKRFYWVIQDSFLDFSDQFLSRPVPKTKKGYGNTEEFGKLEIENYCMGGTGVILSQGLMSEENDSKIIFWLVHSWANEKTV